MTGEGNRADTGAASAGAWLRAAREAAGLSEDAVAQQLKLAPRQVRAIEEDDYARLPGRTFVRGFVRNYARLVQLDPDAVVAALPSGEPTSPLERLTYTPASRPMGELPVDSGRRGGRAARWLIPLLLLAVVGVAAYYEYARQPAPRPALPDGIMPPPAAKPAAPAPAGPSVTPLLNPLEAPKSEPAPPSGAVGMDPAPAAAANAPPADVGPGAASPGAMSPVTASAAAPQGTVAPTAPEAASAEPTLVLDFRGPSWVQVKDSSGALVVSQTAPAGATIPVGGTPPYDVVIGSATSATVRFRDRRVDLVPHTRSNVARLTLK